MMISFTHCVPLYCTRIVKETLVKQNIVPNTIVSGAKSPSGLVCARTSSIMSVLVVKWGDKSVCDKKITRASERDSE